MVAVADACQGHRRVGRGGRWRRRHRRRRRPLEHKVNRQLRKRAVAVGVDGVDPRGVFLWLRYIVELAGHARPILAGDHLSEQTAARNIGDKGEWRDLRGVGIRHGAPRLHGSGPADRRQRHGQRHDADVRQTVEAHTGDDGVQRDVRCGRRRHIVERARKARRRGVDHLARFARGRHGDRPTRRKRRRIAVGRRRCGGHSRRSGRLRYPIRAGFPGARAPW
jgi:hypothetical protein